MLEVIKYWKMYTWIIASCYGNKFYLVNNCHYTPILELPEDHGVDHIEPLSLMLQKSLVCYKQTFEAHCAILQISWRSLHLRTI